MIFKNSFNVDFSRIRDKIGYIYNWYVIIKKKRTNGCDLYISCVSFGCEIERLMSYLIIKTSLGK